jgi:hypothetical protein
MRKADIAEGFLSLTTTPERASATAGDLLQEASARGPLWFWSSLFRTTATLAWRNFSEAPWGLTKLAMKSMWFGSFYGLAAVLCVIIVHLVISIGVAVSLGLSFKETVNPRDSVLTFYATLAFLASSFMMGKWLAKNAPYRELSVFVLSGVCFRLFWASLLLIRWPQTWEGWTAGDIALDIFFMIVGTVFVYAGVEREERHAQS